MKKSRIIVLFLALVAAAGAFVVANGAKAPPADAPVAPVVAEPTPTDDVLVAAKDIPLGSVINDGSLAWQTWPKDGAAAGMLRKSDNPKIMDELKGSIARAVLYRGEPVRREKLVKGAGAGFMSAILPSGKRAVAINIDSQGATSAGGFVLPNDRVDVIRTYNKDVKGQTPGAGENLVSETLLENVKVLAIGQNVEDKNGTPVVVGSNATLELDPAQAETVILGQRTGQLSLVLRSLLDSSGGTTESVRQASHSLSVVRYGAVTQDGNR